MQIKIKDIKEFFYSSLTDIYAKEEISVFFDILIEEYTGLTKIQILTEPEVIIDNIVAQKIDDAIESLKQHEPIQYIIGKSWFYDLEFIVSPDVLIPRPETEELVDLIIKEIHQFPSNNLRILDIGTGSGCIAIALKKNLPQAEITAIDFSDKALEVAKRNSDKNDVSINFIKVDILNHNRTGSDLSLNTFDLIVSNPPYVRESEKLQMLPNVIEYEPHSALFVKDDDALLFYNAIADFCLAGHLQHNGKLYFEINEYLSDELYKLLSSKGFKNIMLKNDINNKARILTCNFTP